MLIYPSKEVNTQFNVYGPGDLDASIYTGLFLKNYKRLHWDAWSTDVKKIPTLPPHAKVIFDYSTNGTHSMIFTLETSLVYSRIGSGHISTFIGFDENDQLNNVTKFLKEIIPPSRITEDMVMPISFWYNTGQGPQCSSRKIVVPSWLDIKSNYSVETSAVIGRMMEKFTPAFGGQLILWSGEPGTGKTYAIRSLMWEWRKWARFHYITDPENFFGRDSAYLLKVITGIDENEEAQTPVSASAPDEAHQEAPEPSNLWRVLLLEDMGEILSQDAKERVGQGLSRLLNVVDGLIGQGLQILVMITTNEEITRLHPAVSRPGRCAFQHKFEKLSAMEANMWLGSNMDRGTFDPVTQPCTISDLYGVKGGYLSRASEKVMGF